MLGLGDVTAAQGNLPSARQLYERAAAMAEPIAKADPGNAEAQRDLAVSLNFVANVYLAQGKLAEALEHYRGYRDIIARLAKGDPGNAGWQRDLSLSHMKIGDVLFEQGNLPAALESHRASLAIAERLAKADPGNAQWQRDLSGSQERIGDVLRAQGNLAAALQSYKADLAIMERLAKADPGNAQWQRDLAIRVRLQYYFHRAQLRGREALAITREPHDPRLAAAHTRKRSPSWIGRTRHSRNIEGTSEDGVWRSGFCVVAEPFAIDIRQLANNHLALCDQQFQASFQILLERTPVREQPPVVLSYLSQ